MEKQEMTQEIQSLLETLKEHQINLNKLVEDLQMIARPLGDVTFSSMDRAKDVLASMKLAKDATERVKRVLKARAIERMKEG